MSTVLKPEMEDISWFQKRSHGKRTIFVPNDAMKIVHRNLIDHLQQLSFDFSSAHGGIPKRSIVTNAREHLRGEHFYVLDIEHAYENVDIERLAEVLDSAGICIEGWETLAFLYHFCVGDEGLATGAPASPLLFNIYCAEMIDSHIRAILDSGTRYTRYLDDITISSDKPLPRVFRRRIRDVLTRAGFCISRHKTRVLQRSKGPIEVAGVQIRSGALEPSVAFMEKVWEEIRQTVPVSKHAQHAQRLHGYANFLSMFIPKITPRAEALLITCRHTAQMLNDQIQTPALFVRNGKITKRMIRTLKNSIAIVDAAEHYLGKGTRRGNEFVWRSPFKQEMTPSFSVSPLKRFYHCFASGQHGDVIDLVMKLEQVSFAEAFSILNDRYQIFPKPNAPQSSS